MLPALAQRDEVFVGSEQCLAIGPRPSVHPCQWWKRG